MKRRAKYLKRSRKTFAINVLLGILLILLLLDTVLIAMVFEMEKSKGQAAVRETVSTVAGSEILSAVTVAPPQEPERTEAAATAEPTTAQTEPAIQETAATEPSDEEKKFLPYLEEYFEKNSEIIGWLKIEGTKLDYPLMYTPEDPEKYLHLNFDEQYSYGGLPFLDANCSVSPESDNLIIYGHNMLDGSMFRTLMKYDQRTYWEKHPVIRLDLFDEEREYEIVAAFYDRVYYTYETCFKFYKFIDAEGQTQFEEAITYYKTQALYDTGVEAQLGDHLITLVTCSYHVDNGRFVVVARHRTE